MKCSALELYLVFESQFEDCTEKGLVFGDVLSRLLTQFIAELTVDPLSITGHTQDIRQNKASSIKFTFLHFQHS